MSTLNRLLGSLFELGLRPLRDLPVLADLAIISLIASIGMLLAFRHLSDQEALGRVKDRIHAGVYEIRLFNHDLGAVLRAQWDIFRHSLRYMRLSIVPMLWLAPPILILLVHLQPHYGYRGLTVGEETIVKVRLADAYAVTGSDDAPVSTPRIELEPSDGLEVASPMLWIPALREADWRVRAVAPGRHELRVRTDRDEFGKIVTVAEALARHSPVRPAPGIIDELMYPVERPLPRSAGIRSIDVHHETAEVRLLGWGMHWMVVFFILTLVFAFTLQRPLGVKL